MDFHMCFKLLTLAHDFIPHGFGNNPLMIHYHVFLTSKYGKDGKLLMENLLG
jgi:hypothetical protein